jgi:UDP-N-acetylglucosamine--N-acetylmuramyl-(pentapeptide) pyrophosphoryl-undecaprenol N-acetylglucosamine transferase
MKTILFTGGGSSGHVTPNLALINTFLAAGWNVLYVGSKDGIEQEIISRLGVTYYPIATGKLRRYFSWRTFFIEPFAILFGIWQAFWLCRKIKPHLLFSKGGFVAFPMVVGAWFNRIPIIVHESDLTPGLANKMSFPFADKICITFEEGKEHIRSKKIVVTGTPIRESLFQGNPNKGRDFCQFNSQDPILLVLGGGQGSTLINQTLRKILPKLVDTFQIVHLCGKGKMDLALRNQDRYKQFEYINEELPDLFACCDVVVSRAGANSVYELLSLKKPHLLIPLSLRASRGDQIVNANYFAKRGLSHVLFEENLTAESLYSFINQVYEKKDEQSKLLQLFSLPNSNQLIYQEVIQLLK